MADSTKVRPFIQMWEGGLSRSTADTASANPAPWPYNGVSGYHTNKGVTYSTFAALAPRLGYEISPDNFFVMPNKIWNAIFKSGYWDVWQLDKMKSQAIANLIAGSYAWGSGNQGGLSSIKKYLATKGYTVINFSQAVNAINELTNKYDEESIFRELIEHRKKYFESLNQPANLKGWLNRLIYGSGSKISMLQLGIETIKKKSS